jgi:hypothetical protein
MAEDAGFAVAITIRESLINDALLTSYAKHTFPRTLTHDVPGTSPVSAIDMFLAPPVVNCRRDKMTIAVQMWGTIDVTMTDTKETGHVLANLTLRLNPTFKVDVGVDRFGVKFQNLDVTFDDLATDVTAIAWGFEVVSGPPFSPAADAYLRSNDYMLRLQQAIQGAIFLGAVNLPSLDASFLGDGLLNAVNHHVAQTKVVAGAVLLGLDITTDGLTGHIETHGDIGQLEDFALSNDVASVTNAVAIPVQLQQAQDEVKDAVSQSGGTLDWLTIEAQTGHFHVSGSAHDTSGSVDFSFDITPQMWAFRPGKLFQYVGEYVKVNSRQWPALAFSIDNPQASASPAWWLDLLGVVGFFLNPGTPFVIFSLAADNARFVQGDISRAQTPDPTPRVQHLKSLVPGGPTVRIALNDFTISTDGTYTGITMEPKALPGALMGVEMIPQDVAGEALGYQVRLPLGAMPDDPALRIRWTVADSQGNVLLSSDDTAAGRLLFTVTPTVDAPGQSEVTVSVRLYRALGAQITDLVNDNIKLTIRPAPAGKGAYVRWFYEVKNPQVSFDVPNDEWRFDGDLRVKRHSNIHRTDDARCENALKSSRYASQPELLDALPFQLADVTLHRSQLCDYCFYGSPGGFRLRL